MQALLWIHLDKQIFRTYKAQAYTTLAETQAYARNEAGAPEPTLEPLHPCWDDIGGEWNKALGALFVQCFNTRYAHLQGHDAYVIQPFQGRLELFRNRLSKGCWV